MRARMLSVISLFQLAYASSEQENVTLVVANGCFWGRQHDFVKEVEFGVLNRTSSEVTSIGGYAGGRSSKSGMHATTTKQIIRSTPKWDTLSQFVSSCRWTQAHCFKHSECISSHLLKFKTTL
jgi:hypothetical protein